MKKSLVISTILASLLFAATGLQAKTETSGVAHASKIQSHQKNMQSAKASVLKEINTQKQMSQSAPKEVITGFQQTFKALQALQKDDVSTAKKNLKEATQMFDTALKADPSLKLLPVASDMEVAENGMDLKQIKESLRLVNKALDHHHVQEAREILDFLRDDIVINSRYIPMDLYPVSTKKALDILNKGDKKKALEILMVGFDTMISDTVIIPIPLLSAEDMVIAASKLDKTKKKDAQKLLEAANTELKKAELLGYTNDNASEYKALRKEIKAVKKEIKGKNAVEKMYDALKNDFKSLVHKTRNKSYKDSIAAKEAKVLQNPSLVKGGAAATAKVEETRSKDLFEAKEKAQSFTKESVQDTKKQ